MIRAPLKLLPNGVKLSAGLEARGDALSCLVHSNFYCEVSNEWLSHIIVDL